MTQVVYLYTSTGNHVFTQVRASFVIGVLESILKLISEYFGMLVDCAYSLGLVSEMGRGQRRKLQRQAADRS